MTATTTQAEALKFFNRNAVIPDFVNALCHPGMIPFVIYCFGRRDEVYAYPYYKKFCK